MLSVPLFVKGVRGAGSRQAVGDSFCQLRGAGKGPCCHEGAGLQTLQVSCPAGLKLFCRVGPFCCPAGHKLFCHIGPFLLPTWAQAAALLHTPLGATTNIFVTLVTYSCSLVPHLALCCCCNRRIVCCCSSINAMLGSDFPVALCPCCNIVPFLQHCALAATIYLRRDFLMLASSS